MPRYNLFPAAEIQGTAQPGYSTGSALAAMERLAAEHLPDGFSYEWTELAFQEHEAGKGGGGASPFHVPCFFRSAR